MSGKIDIEVVYALPDEQILLKQSLREGATVAEAIKASGAIERYPGIDLGINKFGIFGKLVQADTVLRNRDRVEIYRPLIADPKELRRRRAKDQKNMKKDDND